MIGTSHPTVAIAIEGDRLLALVGHQTSGGIRVDGCINATRPESVKAESASETGRWLKDLLAEAGLARAAQRGGAVFALPRGEVVIKRVTLPASEDASDLPGMVRLQMRRHLAVGGSDAAIDFVQMPDAEGDASPTSVSVLAGALPRARTDWYNQVATAAGLRVRRIALKASGAAALLASESQAEDGSILGIALGPGSAEFIVVQHGQLMFARGTDVVLPGDSHEAQQAFAHRLAVEAKRTWISHRVAPDSFEVSSIAVLSDNELGQLVASECSRTLELSARTIGGSSLIENLESMSTIDRAMAAPLAGLLAEPSLNIQRLNFAAPRKAPDRAGARRRGALLAILGLILLTGTAWSLARVQVSKAQNRLANLKQIHTTAMGDYNAFVRDHAQLEHMTRYMESNLDWLGHWAHLSSELPDPPGVLLDKFTGTLAAVVEYTAPRKQLYYKKSDDWRSALLATFNIAGRTTDRDVVDGLRAALVRDDRYIVESRGADVADRFDFTLKSSRRAPIQDEQVMLEQTRDGKREGGDS